MKTETLFISAQDLRAALEKTLAQYQLPTGKPQLEKLLKSATNKLGFLRTTGQGGRSQLDQDHYFIHLSFQEFYAAKYITRIFSEKPRSEEAEAIFQFICREKYILRYQLMLWMSAGLLYQYAKKQDPKNPVFSPLEYFWQAILSPPRDLIGFHHTVLIMHCLDECEADEALNLHQELIGQQWEWFQIYAKKESSNPYINQLIRCSTLLMSKPIIDNLLGSLKRGNLNLKQAAANTLSRMYNPNEIIITALVDALQDRSLSIRKPAANALGKLTNPTPHVITRLLNVFLPEKKWGIEDRYTTANVLNELSNSNAIVIGTLLDALQNEDKNVKQATIKALGTLTNLNKTMIAALIGALQNEDKDVRQTLVETLGRLNNPSETVMTALIRALQNALQDEDKNFRQMSVKVLGGLANRSETAITELLSAVHDSEWIVRQAATKSLGTLTDPSIVVITALLNALRDKDPCVSHTAANGLQNLTTLNETTVAALLETLTDQNWHVRQTVVQVLNKLKNRPQAVMTILLERASLDPDWRVKQTAVQALGELNNPPPTVIETLLTTLQDSDWHVRQTTAHTLGKLIDPRKTPVIGVLIKNVLQCKDSDVNQATAKAAVDHPPLANTYPQPILAWSSFWDIFSECLHRKNSFLFFDYFLHQNWLESVFFGQLWEGYDLLPEALDQLINRSEPVFAALLNALRDKNEYVRQGAAEALTQQASPSKVMVIKLQQVRKMAAQALRAPPDQSLIETLSRTLQDKDWHIRLEATQTLGRLIDSNQTLGRLINSSELVVETLLSALGDEHQWVREVAAETLGKLTNPAESVITELADTAISGKSVRIRHTEIKALSNLNNADERLIEVIGLHVLRDENRWIKEAAIEALGKLINPSEAVITALLGALQNNDISQTAAKVLCNLQNIQHLMIVFQRLTSEQCFNYFSFWFGENYLLCIDPNQGWLIARPGRQLFHIPLALDRLTYLEKQIMRMAKELGYPSLGIHDPASKSNNLLKNDGGNRRQLPNYVTSSARFLPPSPPNKKPNIPTQPAAAIIEEEENTTYKKKCDQWCWTM